MADTKISALTAATTPLAGTEVLPIVQSGVTKQVSVANLTAGRAVSADSLTLTGSPLPATSGGTGQSSYAVGDLLYASTTTALSKLADVATGNALISGGVGVAPSWGKIGLTTHVSGILGTTNGGTGLSSFTANGIAYASSTSALATGSGLTFDGTNFATTGSATVKNLLFSAGTLPAAGNPSIALRSSDNTIYLQSGTANTYVFLDKDQNTMAIVDKTNGISVYGANFVQGTAAKGINFTANSAAAGKTSQLLNWYEEGTWTPGINALTGAFTTTILQSATYTRIGRMVSVQVKWYPSSIGTGSDGFQLTNLPYTASPTNAFPIAGKNISTDSNYNGYIEISGTTMRFSTAMVQNHTYIINGTYFV